MKRRNILKSVAGVSFSSAFLATGSGTAATSEQNEAKSLLSKYDDPQEVRRALEVHSEGVLRSLADENILGSTAPSELAGLKSERRSVREINQIQIAGVYDHQTQTRTGFLRVTEQTSENKIDIFVLPEAGRSYAQIRPESGEKRLILAPDSSPHPGDISIQHDHEPPTDYFCHNWEFSHTETECDWDDHCGFDEKANDCKHDYYTNNEYDVFECTAGEWEGGTTRVLVHSTCTSDCCEALPIVCVHYPCP